MKIIQSEYLFNNLFFVECCFLKVSIEEKKEKIN